VPDFPSDEEARLEGARAESTGSYRNTLAERDNAVSEAYRTRGPGASKLEDTAVLVVVFVDNETVVAAQRDAAEAKQENKTDD
jgi:hypothetical protein